MSWGTCRVAAVAARAPSVCRWRLRVVVLTVSPQGGLCIALCMAVQLHGANPQRSDVSASGCTGARARCQGSSCSALPTQVSVRVCGCTNANLLVVFGLRSWEWCFREQVLRSDGGWRCSFWREGKVASRSQFLRPSQLAAMTLYYDATCITSHSYVLAIRLFRLPSLTNNCSQIAACKGNR